MSSPPREPDATRGAASGDGGETGWTFSDVTAAAGLTSEHGYLTSLVSPDGSFDESRHFAGGVAAGDYDNDGWVDLYAVVGDIGPNALWRNRGDGTFEERGHAAGIARATRFGSGPVFADIDGDGWQDLLIGGVRGRRVDPPTESALVRIFRNRGDGSFEDLTDASDVRATRDTYSAAFGDYDRDGDLDLAMAHWASFISGGASSETLWRNDGGFHFTDVSLASGVTAAILAGASTAVDYSFTPSFSDVNGDGWSDLLIASDFQTSRVLINQQDGTFKDRTDPRVISDENGMGAAIGDYDGDGVLDWFVSSIWDPAGMTIENWGTSGNRLYRGVGDGTFEDVTDAAGVRIGGWGWAASWADFDNDTDLDLIHTNGFGRSADYLPSTAFFDDPTRLFVSNGDGTFIERASSIGLLDQGMGRGVVSLDYDRDGDVDVFIANNSQPPRLFRNDLEVGHHYLTVQLADFAPNPQGVGGVIRVSSGGISQFRELRVGSNFESQDPIEAHFGLGEADVVDVLTVMWPDGSADRFENLEVDRSIAIRRSTPTVMPVLTATAEPTATPPPSPTVPQVTECFGDCGDDRMVTVDEVLTAISIALGAEPLAACRSLDTDGSDSVTVDEIITALRFALEGCPA